MAFTAPEAIAQFVTTPPAVTTFQLGDFRISVLRDGALRFANDGTIFATNATPEAVARILERGGLSKDEIRLDIDAMLVRMPHHLVLLDAGYGLAGKSVLRESLALAGVKPDEITDIFITHSHPDHVGGLVDGQGHAAFPKATIWMSANEWAFMQTEKDVRAEVPVIEAQVKTFVPGRRALPGLVPVALQGHTPGHTGFEIVSRGHKLIDIGDIAHHSMISIAMPEWTLAWDSDKPAAIKTRRRELQMLADTHELMFAPHFPFPGVGRIERAGDGFRFRPQPADR